MPSDHHETEFKPLPARDLTRRRYDRIAPLYDLLEWPMEFFLFSPWRRDLWNRVGSGEVLELGVGTGKNLAHYPASAIVTAVDFSPRMLERARFRARRTGTAVKLELADVQALPYADHSFDTAVTTFVFCSVPDPIAGLREVRRVLRPGGRLIMLEHVLSERRYLRGIMKGLAPLVRRLCGASIDRDTVANVRAAGFSSVTAADLALDIVKRIEAAA
jgi:phosphatidylethanolamine/phosphatidyl-N-methylethanolamine N-methyltransferase